MAVVKNNKNFECDGFKDSFYFFKIELKEVEKLWKNIRICFLLRD